MRIFTSGCPDGWSVKGAGLSQLICILTGYPIPIYSAVNEYPNQIKVITMGDRNTDHVFSWDTITVLNEEV